MMFSRADGSRAVDSRWHKFRQKARENSFSEDEWSDTEKVKYDLDTARITGRENPRTYTIDRTINTEQDIPNGTDIRTLEDR